MNFKHVIDIQVEEQVGELDTAPMRVAALLTLQQHPLDEPCEVTLVVSDDEALQDLNCRFRGVNRPTDVIAFTHEARGPFSGGAAGFPRYLGDIVISIERAREQAAEAGATTDQELQLLTVHGVLHLLGYDHEDPAEKAQMWAVQAQLMKLLGAEIALPE